MSILAVWPAESGATRVLDDGRRVSGGEVFELSGGAPLPAGCVTVTQPDASPVSEGDEPDSSISEPDAGKPARKRSATPAKRRRRRTDD